MHTAKSLKKKNHIGFSYNKNNYRKCLACILALITSLLKPWELSQYFKNTQKLFLFFLVTEIMNLYVKRIRDVKMYFFTNIRTIRFLLDKIRTFLSSRTFF